MFWLSAGRAGNSGCVRLGMVPAAFAAEACEFQLESVDLEAACLGGPVGQVFRGGDVYISEFPAAAAADVKVRLAAGVESHFGPGCGDSPDLAQFGQQVQVSVDGGQRNSRALASDGLVDLLGRGVIFPLLEHLEDQVALW